MRIFREDPYSSPFRGLASLFYEYFRHFLQLSISVLGLKILMMMMTKYCYLASNTS